MLAFIDESGDTGFKFEHGSSRFFTMSLVIFKNIEEATKCDRSISDLKKSWDGMSLMNSILKEIQIRLG